MENYTDYENFRENLRYNASLTALFKSYLIYQSVCASNYAYQPISTDLVFNAQNSVGLEGLGSNIEPILSFEDYCNASKEQIINVKTSNLSQESNTNSFVLMNKHGFNKEEFSKDISNLSKVYEAVLATCASEKSYSPSVRHDDIRYISQLYDENPTDTFADKCFTYPNGQTTLNAKETIESLLSEDPTSVTYYLNTIDSATKKFETATLNANEDLITIGACNVVNVSPEA